MPNVTVDRYASGDCTGLLQATTKTAADGSYGWAKVPAGPTCLQFRDLPDGCFISPEGAIADKTLDSDADPATARITFPYLYEAETNAGVGLYEGLVVVGWVWNDVDRDGIQDAG